ncbi:MAG: LysR family transcriptional regulator [Lachnospiraceae bacterium]|jgi:LysR family transcriptional activator of glutamate synthase operon|nr:LysR family transcriptional regulator [Lachnospiraceae bacterium]
MFKNSLYFLTIVEEKNLSRAAEKLHLTQPALTKYLNRLEKRLGAELFDHHCSPLRLTAAGQHYLSYTRKIIALEKRFLRELSELQTEYHDEIRIGIPPFRGSCILPQLLPEYAALYPHVTLNIIEKKSELLLSDLAKGKLDIAVSFHTDLGEYHSFTCYPVKEEPILLAVRQEHPLILRLPPFSSGPCKDLSQLTKPHIRSQQLPWPHMDMDLLRHEAFALCTPGQTLPQLTERLFADHKFQPESQVHFSDPITNLKLVSTSDCFTFVPEAVAISCLAPENVIYFTVGDPLLHWTLAAFCLNSAPVTRPMEGFIQVLQKVYGDL